MTNSMYLWLSRKFFCKGFVYLDLQTIDVPAHVQSPTLHPPCPAKKRFLNQMMEIEILRKYTLNKKPFQIWCNHQDVSRQWLYLVGTRELILCKWSVPSSPLHLLQNLRTTNIMMNCLILLFCYPHILMWILEKEVYH